MLWHVQADRSQLTQFLEQQGSGQSIGGLPSHSFIAGLLESQHKPSYPLLWSKPLSNVFSYPGKGLKEAALELTLGCGRFAWFLPAYLLCSRSANSVVFVTVIPTYIRLLIDLWKMWSMLGRSFFLHPWALHRATAPEAVQYTLPKYLLMRTSESEESY